MKSGGTLAAAFPNSLGTLTVDGDLTFEAGSTLEVKTDPGSAATDFIDVSGDVTINGGTLSHVGLPGPYGLRSTYTVLAAGGTLSGAFSGASSDYAFLTPELNYDYTGGTVELELLRNDVDFSASAATANQMATADAIDSIGIGAANPVYDAVALLPDNDAVVQAAFDALSGEIGASALASLVEDGQAIRNAMVDRLRAGDVTTEPGITPVLSYAPSAADAFPEIQPVADDTTVWAQGFGSWGLIDGDAGAASLERTTGGLFVGAESEAGAWKYGALVGYGRTSFEIDDRSSSGSTDSLHAGIYAGGSVGDLVVRGGVAYALSETATQRSVSLPGLTDELSASYLAGTFQAFGELAYTVQAGEGSFEPFANLAYASVTREGYDEEGGPAALSVQAETYSVPFVTIGARMEQPVALGEATATLSGGIGWRHALGDLTPETTQGFSEGDVFDVVGTPVAGDSATVQAGFAVALSEGASLDLTYSGQVAVQASQHAVNATLAVSF